MAGTRPSGTLKRLSGNGPTEADHPYADEAVAAPPAPED